MATAVLDIDLQSVPPCITGLNTYDKALILIRYHQRPIGKTIARVYEGCISGAELRNSLKDAIGSEIGLQWLQDQLHWDETATVGFTPPKATVAICTRDRPDDLQRCIEGLMAMPDDGQEILVIDNAPATDATQRIVERYDRVRYVREDKPGLNNARNRALHEAAYEVIAFTDDDAVPEPNWLRSLLRNFGDPLVICATGLTMPLELETEAQEWFESYSPFGKGFQRKVFESARQNPLATGRVGAGANMAVRKSLIEQVGLFDECLDAGTATCSGGDHEMFARILLAGYRIVYDPAALSWHRHRRTMEELRRALYGYGVGVYAFWTRTLLIEREWVMLEPAIAWFLHDQLPNFVRSLLRQPGSLPFNLIAAELQGCLVGTSAYLKARRKAALAPSKS
jgi:cellulose synthase/poly-beta-1,6-N-acetylglucosamine synthase-like glycosyltransferase